MAFYRCGPTAIGSRASWSVTSPMESKAFDRPISGNYDRIFNAFERTNAFEYVRSTFEGKQEERHVGHGDIVVNRKMSSSFERADCALAAQTPCSDDEDFYREKILYSQARQLFPLQEDLADWINKTIGKFIFITLGHRFTLIKYIHVFESSINIGVGHKKQILSLNPAVITKSFTVTM